MDIVDRSQHPLVGGEILGALGAGALQLALAHERYDALRDVVRQTVLEFEHVGERPLESLRPDHAPEVGLGQLRHEAQAPPCRLHRAGEHVAHAEQFGDIARLVESIAKRGRRQPGDDK